MGNVSIGVDFGNQSIKLARLRRRRERILVERLLRIERTDSDTIGAIAAAVREAGMRASGAVMGISGRGAIIRYTSVPPVPAYRLKMIMEYEMGELAGKSPEAISSDYRVLNLPRDVSQEFTLMVAMSKDQFVQESMSGLTAAGIGVSHVLPAPLALYNTFLALGGYEEEKTYLVVDIGAGNVDMVIVREKDLFFARSVGGGADEFTEILGEALGLIFSEAQKVKESEGIIATSNWTSDRQQRISKALSAAADRLHTTLNSSISFARNQLKLKELKIDKVYLFGGGSNLPGLPEYLTQLFDIEVIAPSLLELAQAPVERDLRLDLAQSLPAQDLSAASPALREFTAAIGLALSQLDPSLYSMDLMPAEEKKKRLFKERTVFLYAAGAILVFFLIVRLVVAGMESAASEERHGRLESLLSEAEDRLSALRVVNEESDQTSATIQHLTGLTEPGHFLTRLLFLTRKREVMPPEIQITEMLLREPLKSEEGGACATSVVIRGRVMSRTGNEFEIVQQFHDRLIKSGAVKSAAIDPSSTGSDNKGGFRFEMTVRSDRTK